MRSRPLLRGHLINLSGNRNVPYKNPMMSGSIMTFLQQLPPEIATMILAMLPFTELRASIPVGIKVFGLSPFEALFASVIGNMIPVVLLLLLIKPVTDFA